MHRTTRGKQPSRILSMALILPALMLGLFLLITLITAIVQSPGEKALKRALAKLEKQQGYNLIIIEKAHENELVFKGEVKKGRRLRGALPNYGLEVFYQGDELKLRQNEASEWVESESLALQGLAGFLTTPPEILQNLSSSFPQAYTGEKISLEQGACQTVYFAVDEPKEIAKRLFPEIDYTAISKMIVATALSEPDLSLKQMRILVEFANQDQEQIERSYHLD